MRLLGRLSGRLQQASAIGGYDAHAADFFNRAGIVDGTEKEAINQFVVDLKDIGLWSAAVFIYPCVGGTSATMSHNLVSPSFQITWGGSPTFGPDGVDGDGSTAYGLTGVDPATDMSDQSFVSAYIVDTCTGTFPMVLSSYLTANNIELGLNGAASIPYARYTNASPYLSGSWSTAPNYNGLLTAGREADDSLLLYTEASLRDSDTASGSSLSAGYQIHLLCRATGASRSLYWPSGVTVALWAGFDGVDVSDHISGWSSAVTAFQSALSRAI